MRASSTRITSSSALSSRTGSAAPRARLARTRSMDAARRSVAHRLEEVVDRTHFIGVDGPVVVGGHDNTTGPAARRAAGPSCPVSLLRAHPGPRLWRVHRGQQRTVGPPAAGSGREAPQEPDVTPPSDPWSQGTQASDWSRRRRAPAARPEAAQPRQRACAASTATGPSGDRFSATYSLGTDHAHRARAEDQPPAHVGHPRKDLRELRPAARTWVGGIARLHAGSTPRVGQDRPPITVAPGPRCVWMSAG